MSPNTGATNESGFSALPGGYRGSGGTFHDQSDIGYWWSSTVYVVAWNYSLIYSGADLGRGNYNNLYGFSVSQGSSGLVAYLEICHFVLNRMEYRPSVETIMSLAI
jgi:hypothetical protein